MYHFVGSVVLLCNIQINTSTYLNARKTALQEAS